MGLFVSTGSLADLLANDTEGSQWIESEIRMLNDCLVKHGMDEHKEPRTFTELPSRVQNNGFPYSWIHYLRRVVAHAIADPTWIATPVNQGDDPSTDSEVIDATVNISSHFICHSDCDGFYVPKDFQSVIFGDERLFGGGIIGSSYRLLEEMQVTAKSLGIVLTNGELSDDQAKVLNSINEEDPLMIEKTVWLSIYEAARLSKKYNTLIVFQ